MTPTQARIITALKPGPADFTSLLCICNFERIRIDTINRAIGHLLENGTIREIEQNGKIYLELTGEKDET